MQYFLEKSARKLATKISIIKYIARKLAIKINRIKYIIYSARKSRII